MDTISVSWRGGVWWLITDKGTERIEADAATLGSWLRDRGISRDELCFGDSRALEQKFVHAFGPAAASGRR
jgi:hypothetical protein